MKRFFFLAAVLLTVSSALAQDAWVVTRADFSKQPVLLRGIDAQGVRIQRPGESTEAILPFDQILQLDQSFSGASSAPYTLLLLSGDRLTGEPVSITGDSIAWKSAALGNLTVPLNQARALVAAGASVSGETRKEDWVLLKNSDKVTGTVTALADGSITVSSNGSPVAVPLASISAVEFALLAPPPAAPDRSFRVKLNDGTQLTALSLQYPSSASPKSIALKLAGGDDKTIDISTVVGIEQLNGPVSWLSTRAPTQSVQIPMLGRVWPAQMDLNVDGKAIHFGDRAYSRGIGVHSYSKIVFPLDSSYKAFRTQFAIDGSREKANCTARILLDDKVVYEQKDVVGGKLWPVVTLDLGDAKSLTLEVDSGPTSWVQGHFNWIEPALLKSMPTTQP